MFIRRSRVSLVAFIAGVGLFAGCEDSQKSAESAAGPSNPVAPKPGDALPADMVAAVSANRTNNSISVHFSLGEKPEVNNALPVEIAIVPRREYAAVSAHFLSQNGLAVSVGDSFGPVSNPAGGKPLRHQLVLLPGREGVFVVTASIETTEPAGNVTRVFSIPVVVSPPGGEVAKEADTAQPQSPESPVAN